MKANNTEVTLEISELTALVVSAAESLVNKQPSKQQTPFEINEDTEWVMGCLDDIMDNIKESRKLQDEQEKRLERLEKRADNINARVDSFIDKLVK